MKTHILLLALLLPSLALATTPGEQLLEAAQNQDVATVRELLASGGDVNHRSRYGATALLFAADKGNLEIVKLLLEAGAEIDAEDTFYKATPIGFALFSVGDAPAYKEIVLLLLEKGSNAAADVLSFGVRTGDMDLVRGAVATGKLEEKDLRTALERATKAAAAAAEDDDTESLPGLRELVALLAPLVPERTTEEAPAVPAEVLATYVGDYNNDDIGMQARVFIEDDRLLVQAQGQEALVLTSTGEHTFSARDVDGIDFAFARVEGSVTGFQLSQGGQQLDFPRVLAEPEAPDANVAPVALAPLGERERTAARPWPGFRGKRSSGIGDGQGVPFTWDGEAGTNVVWKREIPGLALSSPVVWGDRVFVSTAVSGGDDAGLRIGLYGDVDSVDDASHHAWKVYALSKSSGEVLWTATASEGAPKVKRHLKSSHANPTPVTDGKHLVIHFPSEGVYGYDLDGNLLWKKELGVLPSGWFYDATYQWGFASSPILHDGKVILQVDIQRGSFLAALDVTTGEEVWRTERDEIPTWGTPVVLPGTPDEIVTNGTTVRGYDAATGEELWTLAPNSEITVASPVVAEGVAYVTGGYRPAQPVYAIKAGGRSDVSPAEDGAGAGSVVWSHERGGVYIPTPLVYEGVLYLLHNNGRLVALDAATGEEIYKERVGSAESFTSSPVAADGRLLFTSEDGTTYVVRAGESYELLETNELGEIVMATPAISDGLLVVRGARHVWGLGRK